MPFSRNYLVTSFRRVIGLALTGLVLTAGTARAQTKQPAKGAAASTAVPQEDSATFRRRVNTTVLAEARKDVEKILQEAGTSYSQELSAAQNNFTAISRTIPGHSPESRVVFVDHNRFASALALGLSPKAAAAQILKSHRINVADSLAKTLGSLLNETSFLTAIMSPVHRADPQAFIDTDQLENVCIIISADASGNMPISNLSPAEKTEFINSHEGWHCLYTKYNPFQTDSLSPAEKTVAQNKAEAFADLGSVGDMIRRGHTMDIIDKIADWRGSAADDVEHYSVPALMELKKRIEDMGLEEFRALSMTAMQEIYYDITDHYCFTLGKLNVALAYLSADSTKRLDMEQQALTNPEIKTAVDLAQQMEDAADPMGVSMAASPTDALAARTYITAWNPLLALKKKALSLHGEITPRSLIKAHAALQDSLQTVMQENPQNPLYPAQAGMLKKFFEYSVSRLDYVAVNQRYGVDLSKSPTFSQLMKPPTDSASKPQQTPKV